MRIATEGLVKAATIRSRLLFSAGNAKSVDVVLSLGRDCKYLLLDTNAVPISLTMPDGRETEIRGMTYIGTNYHNVVLGGAYFPFSGTSAPVRIRSDGFPHIAVYRLME